MFAAMIIWNIWHPGRYLHGEESEFPKKVKVSRKEKKRIKQEAKDRKRRDRRRSSSRRGKRDSEYHLTSTDEGTYEDGYAMHGRR